MCYGGRCQTFRRHAYKLARLIDSDAAHGSMFDFIYECSVCGDERVWGNEHRERIGPKPIDEGLTDAELVKLAGGAS
jgi:hypothetical protein